ncbi:MAG: acylphosphatase, partial [Chitinophagaceae bacterium]
AQSLELKGWVRNTKDGHVEAVASGNKEALQQFVEWCKQGPEKAVVTSIETTAVADEEFDHFRLIR